MGQNSSKKEQLPHHLLNNYIRTWVSKSRRRMIIGGYDLDMTYITERLLAMSFPSENLRAVYRNPLWQVKEVLDMRHCDHYKVYNLCIEESYGSSQFYGRVERYPFDDNHVPPISMIIEFCEDVHSWLLSNPKNIAVVHCMAGKGRTGLMVSCYLVYAGMSAERAMQMYAERRTTNNDGVSIASQRRYVAYWENLVTSQRNSHLQYRNIILPEPRIRELKRIRLYDTMNMNSIFVVVKQLQEVHGQRYRPYSQVSRICCTRTRTHNMNDNEPRFYSSFVEEEHEQSMDTLLTVPTTCLNYDYENPLIVRGDVCLAFFQKMIGLRLFYVCFNTNFVDGNILQFSMHDLDKVGSRGRSICGPSFCLELMFTSALQL